MSLNCCSICQQINNRLRRLDDVDEKGVDWLAKLRSIVPELEHSEDFLICNACIQEVDCFLKIRNRLLDIVSGQRKAKKFIQKEVEYDDSYCADHGQGQEIEECESQLQNDLESVTKTSEEFLHLGCKIDYVLDKKIIAQNYTSEGNSKNNHECKGAKIVEQENHPNGMREENIAAPKKRRGRKPERICTCEVCGKQFDYIKDIITHCVSIHSMDKKSVKPYSCNKCCQRFTCFANYDQHQKYHNKNRDHICSLCGKGFMTKSDLMVHEYTHFNRRNYKCAKCDKAFNTNKNLRTHILVVHTESSAWKYACSLCKKSFPLKSNYDQHMKRHSGDKQQVCHICRRSFVTNSELKRHIALHTNIRPFKCEYCKKDYKEFRTLKAHLKQIHSVGDAKLPIREKKYVCHICPSQFYDKQKLARHLCSHSGVKPFGCSSCDKKFTDKSYLKYHMKSFHNVTD